MKKISSVLLILALLLGLCACGTKSVTEKKTASEAGESDKKSEEKVEEAEVGTILNTMEVTPALEKFYVCFTFADEQSENGISSMEIAMDDTEEPGIIYVTDGTLKLNEMVYEMDADGNITKYVKDVFMTEFVKDESLSQESLQNEKEKILDMLGLLGFGYGEDSSVKYKKCESVDYSFLPGPAYAYEVISDSSDVSTIWLDRETGIVVNLCDADGNSILSVSDIKTENIGIPTYK